MNNVENQEKNRFSQPITDSGQASATSASSPAPDQGPRFEAAPGLDQAASASPAPAPTAPPLAEAWSSSPASPPTSPSDAIEQQRKMTARSLIEAGYTIFQSTAAPPKYTDAAPVSKTDTFVMFEYSVPTNKHPALQKDSGISISDQKYTDGVNVIALAAKNIVDTIVKDYDGVMIYTAGIYGPHDRPQHPPAKANETKVGFFLLKADESNPDFVNEIANSDFQCSTRNGIKIRIVCRGVPQESMSHELQSTVQFSSNKVCGATTMSNAELTAQIQNTFNATATHRAAESGGPIASTRVTVYRTVQAGNLDTQIVVACTALNAAAFDMLANIRELIVTITTKFTGPLQFQRAVFKVASLSEVLRPHGQKFDRNYSLAAALDGWTPNVTHPGVPVYMTTVLAAPRHTTAAPAAAVSATAASATAAAASASRPPGAGGSSAHRVPDAPRTRPQQQQQQSQQQQQRQQQQHSKAGAKSSHGMSDNDDDDDNNYGGKQKPTSAGYKTVASRKSPRMPTPKKTFQQTVASKSKPAATASKTAPKAKPSSSSTSSQQRKQVQDTNDYATEYYLAKPPPVTFQDAFSASESAATKTPNTKRKVDNLHASSANTDSSSPTTSPAHKHPHIDVDNIDSPSPAAAEPETETVQEQQPQECCTSASQQQLLQAPTTADSAGVETERQGETETGDRQ
jgi:hypothetical protein